MLQDVECPLLPESPDSWDETMLKLEEAMAKPTLAQAVHDVNVVPIRVTCDGSAKVLSMVDALHVVDEGVKAVIDNLASTHDMTRSLFALYGCHASAISTASYQMSIAHKAQVDAAAAAEKKELAVQKEELMKLHCQVLNSQAKMQPVVEELARNVKLLVSSYADLKQRVDVLETDKLPASPIA